MSLTPAELEERKKGLFATDAAPALGLSKYRTPVQVWMEKIGEPMPDSTNPEAEERLRMGHIMQPVIARLYEDRQQVRVKDLEGITIWHKELGFMGSHFDYVTEFNNVLVECKNFHPMRMKEFGEDGSDDVPMDCLVQCVHEAIVFGVTRVDLAVLFGGQSFRVFPITVQQDTIDMVVEREKKFWQQVVEKVAPPPVTPEETRRLWPKDNGVIITAPASIQEAVNQLANLKSNMKKVEKLRDDLETQIQTAMGAATGLSAPDGTMLATWKRSADGFRVDTEALKKAGLYEQYSKPTEGSRRFLLKV